MSDAEEEITSVLLIIEQALRDNISSIVGATRVHGFSDGSVIIEMEDRSMVVVDVYDNEA